MQATFASLNLFQYKKASRAGECNRLERRARATHHLAKTNLTAFHYLDIRHLRISTSRDTLTKQARKRANEIALSGERELLTAHAMQA